MNLILERKGTGVVINSVMSNLFRIAIAKFLQKSCVHMGVCRFVVVTLQINQFNVTKLRSAMKLRLNCRTIVRCAIRAEDKRIAVSL